MATENPEEPLPGDEDAPDLDEEAEHLLEIWGVTGDGGRQKKRKVARFSYNPGRAHPGFIFTDHIRHQHLANLVTCMRHFDAVRDDAALAAVLATLLEVQNLENLKPQFRARKMAAQTLICEIIMTGYRMLRRQPGAATYEQLQRLLRRAKPFQISEHGKAAVGILLAELMKEEGHSADGYDALLLLNPPEGSREYFQRRYLLAKIRHGQWTEAMQAAAAPKTRGGPSQPSQPTTSVTTSLQTWNPFKNSTQIWGKAGRNARDLSHEAQVHFEKAIALCPEACTDGVITLVEMAASQGKIQEALDIAREQCNRAPLDTDAHAMTLSLLVASRKASKKHAVSIEEIMQRCTSVLQTNCGDSERAVQVLLKLRKKLPDNALPPLILLQGLCAYLDTTSPLLRLSGLVLKAWNVLSDCLVSMSEITLSAYKTAKEARDKLRHLQQSSRSGRGSGAIAAEEAVDTAAEVMKATELDYQQAVSTYKAVQRLLQQRAWWQDCHLQLPKTTSKLTRLVTEGTANIETLMPLSIVHCVQLHAIESLKGTRVKLDLAEPSSMFLSDKLAIVNKTMKEVGTAEEIQQEFLANCKTVRSAALGILTSGEDAVYSTAMAAALAKITSTSNAVEGHGDMQMEGAENTEPLWKPYPLGAPHPEIGFISQLPDTWWSVFPQKRREERRKHEKTVQGAEEEATAADDEEEEIAAGGEDRVINNAHIGTQETQQTQRRVRFTLPDTQVESAMDTD